MPAEDERPTTPVPRPTDAEVRALRLERFKRDSERLLALRRELLADGVEAGELEDFR